MRKLARRRERRLSALALVTFLAGTGCQGERGPTPPPPPRDTSPPELRVVYPTEVYGAYDRDSNGLADIEVAWRDSAGALNPASLRITCIDCLPGPQQDTNLAAGWRTVRRDSAGAVLEETIPLLMRSGPHLLTVTVEDTAGNRSRNQYVYLNLPPGAFHRTIDLAYRPEWQPGAAVVLVLTPDGRKGFVPFMDGHLAVFDPEGAAPTHYIGPIANSCFAAQISLDTATGLAYIGGGGCPTPGFQVVDTRTEQPLVDHWVGLGVAAVHQDGNRIYVGEACTTGRIIVLDKVTLQEIGRVEVGAVQWEYVCTNTRAFALTSDGRRGWGGMVDGGLVWFDAQTFSVLQRFRMHYYAPIPDDYGSVTDVKLLGDRWLYIAALFDGLSEWDTQNGNTQTAHYGTVIKFLALSPGGHLLFASAVPDGTHTSTRAPLLFEVPGLHLRYAYPQRPGIEPGAAVFHPDGKRVYVMGAFNVDVYLVRPM